MNRNIILTILFTIIIIGGFFFYDNYFKEDLGEETLVISVRNIYEGDANDILRTGAVWGKSQEETKKEIILSVNAQEVVNDLYGEITSYPATATIEWSATDGWQPATQYFTFENLLNQNVDNVKLAGRFNGQLEFIKFYEEIIKIRLKPNGSYYTEELIGYSENNS